ncbi:hypothetical protein OEZ86_010273 [Tetradesmus obliquus]|nr:hypothetical protein OEZ86_010273 [Tetradesmus obliquus]
MLAQRLRSTSACHENGRRRSSSLRTASTRRRVHVPALPRSWEDDAAPEPTDMVQETITFFTADGIVRIPGRMLAVPRSSSSSGRSKRSKQQPMPSWEEQRLCIGQTFEVAAWNARDPNRRVNFLGFCQSVDLLQEAVEETVTSRGGEVLEQERQLRSGLSEALRLTVVIPYLWGVPPEVDLLSAAIQQGGGIVDRVYKQWGMFPGLIPVYSNEAYPYSGGSRGSSC